MKTKVVALMFALLAGNVAHTAEDNFVCRVMKDGESAAAGLIWAKDARDAVIKFSARELALLPDGRMTAKHLEIGARQMNMTLLALIEKLTSEGHEVDIYDDVVCRTE